MTMNRHDAIFVAGLAVFSGLTSFAFVFRAVGILTAGDAPEWDRVFAWVAAGYGLGNIYTLSAAWHTGSSWSTWINKLIALCFFGVFLMDLWKTGGESPLEYVGALVVAGVLWLNWFAVKKVCLRKNPQTRATGAMAVRKGKGGRRGGS